MVARHAHKKEGESWATVACFFSKVGARIFIC